MIVVIAADIQGMLSNGANGDTNGSSLSWPIANLMNFTIDLHPLETRGKGSRSLLHTPCHPVSNAVCNVCNIL
jgi:hypothetical protein